MAVVAEIKRKIIFIRYGKLGEVGDGTKQAIHALDRMISHKSIKKVFSVNSYTIYSDDELNKLCSMGYNEYG